MGADQLETEFEALNRSLAELWRLYEEMQRTPLRFPPAPEQDEAASPSRDGEAA